MIHWLVIFVNWATGSVFFHLSEKEDELDAVEEAGTKTPKSSWIWGVIKNPSQKEKRNAKKKMENLGKIGGFNVQQNRDGTITRKEEE